MNIPDQTKLVMADKRASNFPTRDDGLVFHFFNRLPWELRHMIWQHALPRPIPQVLVYESSTFSKWDLKTKTWDATDGPPSFPIPPPALLHATKESREFALKHVSVREEGLWGPDPRERFRIVSRPFDREIDGLFIHKLHFNAFVDVYMATTPWVARHLVLDNRIYRYRRHTFRGVWNSRWDDFKTETDRMGRGLQSIALAAPNSCDMFLSLAAFPDPVAKEYYGAVPDSKTMKRRHYIFEGLAAEFRGRQGPDGLPREVRVGSERLCGADGGEDDEEILECSQVVLKRFTFSNMDQE